MEVIVALLTAFYMTRALILTFFGSYRGDAETGSHIHESPWIMLGPLVILAIGSATVGFVKIPKFVEPALRVSEGAHAAPHGQWLPIFATAVAVTGMVLGYYLYLAFPEIPSRIYASARGVARVLENKYGFDAVYDRFASRVVVGGSEEVLWRGVDVRLIDGAVNGAASLTAAIARSVRTVQVGRVRGYALVILGGAVAVLSYLLWPR